MDTKKKRFIKLIEETAALAFAEGYGDPGSYAGGKEIVAAIHLGHEFASDYSGADAYTTKGEPVEYKSTISKKVQGTYSGISNYETWEKQVEYLKNEKIGKYPWHFYNRFERETGKMVESWMLSGSKVLELLLPRLKASFEGVSKRKDPRLSATIKNADIIKHGEKVI